MENLTYEELIEKNLLVSKCCVCGVVVEYKDAGRELTIGDLVVSHTYCVPHYKQAMEIDQYDFLDL